MKVEVPVSVAYGLYSERESIPRWMTFISSVKVMSLFVCLFVYMTVSVATDLFLMLWFSSAGIEGQTRFISMDLEI